MPALVKRCIIPAIAVLSVLCLLACKSMIRREPIVVEMQQRRIDLNGPWLIAFDLQNGETTVPGAWQSTRAGVGYDGIAWYYKSVVLPTDPGHGLTLRFEDVNYHAKVWLNGHYVGEHEGSYVPFDFEVGPFAKPGETNDLVVRVTDTPRLEFVDGLNLYQVPHGKESWYVNFGGICGDVSLAAHGDAWLDDVFLVPDPGAPAITVRCSIASAEGAEPVTLTATASAANNDSIEYGSASVEIDPKKNGEVGLQVPLREALLWSPEHPFLYRVSVRLVRGQDILDEADDTVGLRTFDIRDNDFYLNGRRIVLNAVLNQPFFPGTLCGPPDDEWCKRQVRLMKEAGLNAVQNHVRLAPKEFLYEADRQGLLVFQQPSIGWVYCSDDQALEERLLAQVEGMVLRDRNHPSVVMWGIFNEGSIPQLLRSLPGLGAKYAEAICRLDPTRPILDETGSGRAHYYPAGSAQGTPYFDAHWYPFTPMADVASRRMRAKLEKRGQKSLSVVSEYGYGGITDLNDAVEQHGLRHRFREDCRYFSELRSKIRKSVGSWPLSDKFDSLNDFTDALHQWHARAVHEQYEIFVTDPALDMLCLTQWQDCVGEPTGGLVDVWGSPKPVWHTLKRITSPIQMIVRAPQPTRFIGESCDIEVVVVNNPGVRGPAVLTVELRGPLGVVAKPELHVQLSGKRVQHLGNWALGSPRSEGRHTINATLSHFGETIAWGGTLVMAVSKEAARIASPVTVYDPEGKLKAHLAAQQAETNDLADCDEVHPVIIATSLGSAPAEAVARFFAAVREGAWGILLSPPRPGDPLHLSGLLSPDVVHTGAPWMGYYVYAAPHPIFEGLPVDDFFGSEYRNIMSRYSLAESEQFTPNRSWDSVCGAVTGYGGFVGHCVLSMPMGKGKIMLSTFRLIENLDTDPVAVRILANMIRSAETASGRTESQPLQVAEVQAVRDEYERLLKEAKGRSREFLLVGPWPLKPADGQGSSFDMVLPPEQDLDPSASYTAWDEADIKWRKTEISPYGRLVLPPAFCHCPYVVGYAYTYVKSPEALTAELVVTSGKPIKVWFDAREKYLRRDPITRLEGHEAGTKEIRSTVKMRKGLNQLLIKFGWAGNPSYVDVRFLRYGREIPDLEYVAPEAPRLTVD